MEPANVTRTSLFKICSSSSMTSDPINKTSESGRTTAKVAGKVTKKETVRKWKKLFHNFSRQCEKCKAFFHKSEAEKKADFLWQLGLQPKTTVPENHQVMILPPIPIRRRGRAKKYAINAVFKAAK